MGNKKKKMKKLNTLFDDIGYDNKSKKSKNKKKSKKIKASTEIMDGINAELIVEVTDDCIYDCLTTIGKIFTSTFNPKDKTPKIIDNEIAKSDNTESIKLK